MLVAHARLDVCCTRLRAGEATKGRIRVTVFIAGSAGRRLTLRSASRAVRASEWSPPVVGEKGPMAIDDLK